MPFKPFFPPSSEITHKLMRRIGQRRAMTLRHEASLTANSSEPENELLQSVLEALETDAENDAAADWEDQRWLSEVLYHFMGLRAGRIRRGAETCEIKREEIVAGMRDGLGLYHTDLPLLEELANEFTAWLREQEHGYVAGWGVIAVDPYDPRAFRLEPLEMNGSKRSQPEPLIKIAGEKAKAAQGGITTNLDLIER